jgi:hypothetical protein
MLSTFQKDWATPRTCQSFTGIPVGSTNPAGTILHVINNTRIPCTEEEFTKFGKSHISFTVVAIKKLGFSYAPWKKNPKAGAPKQEGTKKLFDEPQMFEYEQERVFKSVNVYCFPREGKSDKGPRNEDYKGSLEVGMTFHMGLKPFMFERKSKGENVFPDSPSVFEPFQLLEMVVSATTDEQATKGYGLTLSSLRGLPYSMYSCYTPVWRELLLNTPSAIYEKVRAYTTDITSKGFIFNAILEAGNVGFLAHIKKDAYVTEGPSDGWWTLMSDSKEVTTEVQKIDIENADLMGMTNSGGDQDYVRFLISLASAADALDFWVFKNEYNANKNPNMSEYRGVPLIDTNKLLAFITTDETDAPTTVLHLPFDFPGLDNAIVTIHRTPAASGTPDNEETCVDLVLRSASVHTERGYKLMFGSVSNPRIMPVIFKSNPTTSGVKRSFSRVDWNTFSRD